MHAQQFVACVDYCCNISYQTLGGRYAAQALLPVGCPNSLDAIRFDPEPAVLCSSWSPRAELNAAAFLIFPVNKIGSCSRDGIQPTVIVFLSPGIIFARLEALV